MCRKKNCEFHKSRQFLIQKISKCGCGLSYHTCELMLNLIQLCTKALCKQSYIAKPTTKNSNNFKRSSIRHCCIHLHIQVVATNDDNHGKRWLIITQPYLYPLLISFSLDHSLHKDAGKMDVLWGERLNVHNFFHLNKKYYHQQTHADFIDHVRLSTSAMVTGLALAMGTLKFLADILKMMFPALSAFQPLMREKSPVMASSMM